jgi:hypothetical protein
MPTILNPKAGPTLSDARLQFHHAAQFATAAGISYLPKRADDSHTNLEWLAEDGMLASNSIPAPTPFRIVVRARDLLLRFLDPRGDSLAELPLDGRTIAEVERWIRARLPELGADAGRFTLARHYEIPRHAVDGGAAFDTSDVDAFEQLAAWFDTAAVSLEHVRQSVRDAEASDVRCWPHHFDIATLITVSAGQTVGVGLEPGDVYYDEPYFYVNMSPSPATAPKRALAAHGSWHTHEWIGAVLPVSRLTTSNTRDEIGAFLRSAVTACRAELG